MEEESSTKKLQKEVDAFIKNSERCKDAVRALFGKLMFFNDFENDSKDNVTFYPFHMHGRTELSPTSDTSAILERREVLEELLENKMLYKTFDTFCNITKEIMDKQQALMESDNKALIQVAEMQPRFSLLKTALEQVKYNKKNESLHNLIELLLDICKMIEKMLAEDYTQRMLANIPAVKVDPTLFLYFTSDILRVLQEYNIYYVIRAFLNTTITLERLQGQVNSPLKKVNFVDNKVIKIDGAIPFFSIKSKRDPMDIRLELEESSGTLVIGTNESGKTTFFHLIMTCLDCIATTGYCPSVGGATVGKDALPANVLYFKGGAKGMYWNQADLGNFKRTLKEIWSCIDDTKRRGSFLIFFDDLIESLTDPETVAYLYNKLIEVSSDKKLGIKLALFSTMRFKIESELLKNFKWITIMSNHTVIYGKAIEEIAKGAREFVDRQIEKFIKMVSKTRRKERKEKEAEQRLVRRAIGWNAIE